MERIEEAKIGFVAGFVGGVVITNYMTLVFGIIAGFVCGALVYFRQEIWKAYQDWIKKKKEANKK